MLPTAFPAVSAYLVYSHLRRGRVPPQVSEDERKPSVGRGATSPGVCVCFLLCEPDQAFFAFTCFDVVGFSAEKIV